MNILITSVGRRHYIVDYFNECLNGNGRVVTLNSLPFSAGVLASKKNYIAPPIRSDSYIPFVMTVCEKENIDLLISLFDQDLLRISKSKDEFIRRGTKVAVSDADAIKVTFDKLSFSRFLEKAGISSPKTTTKAGYDRVISESESEQFPVILKPRWGTGSIATQKVANYKEYSFFHDYLTARLKETYIDITAGYDEINEIIVQEYVEGDEYHLDVINDFEGNFAAVFPKKKLSMRNGETDCAITIRDEELVTIGAALSCHLRHVGLLDVDVIKDKRGRYHVIDGNPRFGGGYPFAHAAGANVPACYVNWAQNKPPESGWLTVQNDVLGVKGYKMLTKQLDPTQYQATNE